MKRKSNWWLRSLAILSNTAQEPCYTIYFGCLRAGEQNIWERTIDKVWWGKGESGGGSGGGEGLRQVILRWHQAWHWNTIGFPGFWLLFCCIFLAWRVNLSFFSQRCFPKLYIFGLAWHRTELVVGTPPTWRCDTFSITMTHRDLWRHFWFDRVFLWDILCLNRASWASICPAQLGDYRIFF